jgi:hypothetical protein
VPAGIDTVSPSPAEFIAFWTSACEQLAALIVAAWETRARASRPIPNGKKIARVEEINIARL